MERYKHMFRHGTVSAFLRLIAYLTLLLFVVMCMNFLMSRNETPIPVRTMYKDVAERAKAIDLNLDIDSPKLKEVGIPDTAKKTKTTTTTTTTTTRTPRPRPTPLPKTSPTVRQSGVISEQAQVGDCVPLTFGENLLPIAATGFPASGHELLGHLIQQSTGFYVGSAYCGDHMLHSDFRGECRHDDAVVVVRTHRMCYRMCCEDDVIKLNYSKAIILIRNPYDSLKSEFNRLGERRIGHAPLEDWRDEWPNFVEKMASNWKMHMLLWLGNFQGPVMILRYEDLRKNMRNEIKRLVGFLGYHITEEHLNCVIKNAKGRSIRKWRNFLASDPYTPEMRTTIDGYIKEVNEMIERYWGYKGKYFKRQFCPWKYYEQQPFNEI